MKLLWAIVLCVIPATFTWADIDESKVACASGVAAGCERVADTYAEGKGVPQDSLNAVSYYLEGCYLGSGYACRWSGVFYDPDFKYDLQGKSYERANEFYSLACDYGDGIGCNNMGMAYRKKGKSKANLKKALKYFSRGCFEVKGKSVDKEACLNAGFAYGEGEGVNVDIGKAVKAYKKSCELNHSSACFNLGVLYHKGKKVKPSLKLAKTYYERACKLGDQDSCKYIQLFF